MILYIQCIQFNTIVAEMLLELYLFAFILLKEDNANNRNGFKDWTLGHYNDGYHNDWWVNVESLQLYIMMILVSKWCVNTQCYGCFGEQMIC